MSGKQHLEEKVQAGLRLSALLLPPMLNHGCVSVKMFLKRGSSSFGSFLAQALWWGGVKGRAFSFLFQVFLHERERRGLEVDNLYGEGEELRVK